MRSWNGDRVREGASGDPLVACDPSGACAEELPSALHEVYGVDVPSGASQHVSGKTGGPGSEHAAPDTGRHSCGHFLSLGIEHESASHEGHATDEGRVESHDFGHVGVESTSQSTAGRNGGSLADGRLVGALALLPCLAEACASSSERRLCFLSFGEAR